MKLRLSIGVSIIGTGLFLLAGLILAIKVLTDAGPNYPPNQDLLLGHTASINALAFDPTNQALASGSDDGTVKLWDLETKKELLTIAGHLERDQEDQGTFFEPHVRVLAIAFSNDGRILASGDSDGRAKLWAPSSGKEIISFKVHRSAEIGFARVASLAFARDGSSMAAGVSNTSDQGSPWSCKVIFWNIKTRKQGRTLSGENCWPSVVAFTPDGEYLALTNGRKVTLWDFGSGREEVSPEKPGTESLMSMSISPYGRLLAAGENQGDRPYASPLSCDVILWDLVSRKEIATLKGHGNWVSSVAFSPDNKLLASASWDGTVRLWGVAERKQLAVLTEHDGPVYAVAFSPDAKILASGGKDGAIRLWEVDKLLGQDATK